MKEAIIFKLNSIYKQSQGWQKTMKKPQTKQMIQ
tara:strand:+ start:670 stop:771 length:102 start_codon:yes stop_codon:yes gene_type:complete